MPNHVTTTFRVIGQQEHVAQFIAAHIIEHPEKTVPGWKPGTTRVEPAHTQFDFQTVIPMPSILDGIQSSSILDDAAVVLTGKTLAQLRVEHDPSNPIHVADFDFKQRLKSLLPISEEHRAKRRDNLTVEQLQMGARAIEAINETGYPTWYEWCCANWGTKWNSYKFQLVTNEPGEYVFRFETAWSAPTPIFKKLCALYPTLSFSSDSYDECGNFAEMGVSRNGFWVETQIPVDDAAYMRAYGYAPDRDDDEDTSGASV